jgi:hypothetical protein
VHTLNMLFVFLFSRPPKDDRSIGSKESQFYVCIHHDLQVGLPSAGYRFAIGSNSSLAWAMVCSYTPMCMCVPDVCRGGLAVWPGAVVIRFPLWDGSAWGETCRCAVRRGTTPIISSDQTYICMYICVCLDWRSLGRKKGAGVMANQTVGSLKCDGGF